MNIKNQNIASGGATQREAPQSNRLYAGEPIELPENINNPHLYGVGTQREPNEFENQQ